MSRKKRRGKKKEELEQMDTHITLPGMNVDQGRI